MTTTDASETTCSTFTVLNVERFTRVPGPRQGWSAVVGYEGIRGGRRSALGLSQHVSRFDDEARWVIDGEFVGSMPRWWNGLGSRCTVLHHVHNLDVVDALDAAVEAVAS